MLKNLSIQNYAIIDKLHLEFSEALNIVTGETGAGKSIMLGAISLVLGKRADSKVLFDQAKKCIVEIVFDELPKEVSKFLDREGFDEEEELIIRREINSNGKSRAFINDTPATLKMLNEISSHLIDLNRQFELLDIQEADFQLNMIDANAGTQSLVEKYTAGYHQYKQIKSTLNKLKVSEGEAAKELDFLKFQYQELEELALESGEQKIIEDDLSKLEKSQDLIQLVEKTQYTIFGSEQSVSDQLSELARQWMELETLDPLYKNISDAFANIDSLLTDIERKSKQAENLIDADPQRKAELEERLNQIYSLLKKHRVDDDESLLKIYNEIGGRLKDYTSTDDQIEALEKDLAEMESTLFDEARSLSTKRQKSFSKLLKKIKEILDQLAMGNSELKIKHDTSDSLSATGLDNIEIQFSANPGVPIQSIKKVASGGELSRLMLAMKTTVADQMDLPTLIFDEIDTGVSGEVAHKMGGLMKRLGKKHQVIVITHSPQVAAAANKQFHMYKEVQGKRTFTRLKELTSEERITEIAKMLSGANPSVSAISNAKELLDID